MTQTIWPSVTEYAWDMEYEYELVHTPENSQLLQRDISSRRLLLRGNLANKKSADLDAANAIQGSHHNAAFLLRRRISKMRASGRPLKSLSFLIARREGYALRIK
jgi:hypothetical protein